MQKLGSLVVSHDLSAAGVAEFDSERRQRINRSQVVGECPIHLSQEPPKPRQIVSFWKFNLMADEHGLDELLGSLLGVESHGVEVFQLTAEEDFRSPQVLLGLAQPLLDKILLHLLRCSHTARFRAYWLGRRVLPPPPLFLRILLRS